MFAADVNAVIGLGRRLQTGLAPLQRGQPIRNCPPPNRHRQPFQCQLPRRQSVLGADVSAMQVGWSAAVGMAASGSGLSAWGRALSLGLLALSAVSLAACSAPTTKAAGHTGTSRTLHTAQLAAALTTSRHVEQSRRSASVVTCSVGRCSAIVHPSSKKTVS